MGKELILIKIKIVTLDGGNSARKKVKDPILMLLQVWNWLELGIKTKLLKEDGYFQMEHITAANLKKTNQMVREFGR